MRITIEYDSCWQTTFLDSQYDTPVSKRKFVATTKTKGDKPAQITMSTVLGVLYRLIGDQRKLYQIKESDNSYFSNYEECISFQLVKTVATDQELMYLTNKSEDRCGQSNFLGVLSDDNPWFFSDEAPLLWSVLFLDKEQLISFILCEEAHLTPIDDCTPKSLILRLNEITDTKNNSGAVLKVKSKLLDEKSIEINKAKQAVVLQKEKSKLKKGKQKEKSIEKVNELQIRLDSLNAELEYIKVNEEIDNFDKQLNKVVDVLSAIFPNSKRSGEEYCKGGIVYPTSIYSAALYLQAKRLLDRGEDISFVKTKNGDIHIQGFSKRGFNGVRDWLNKMTGGRKKAVGTPCIVQKQTGQLEVEIDVDKEKAKEIESMIECAGVSSFYLGKKGLAYVSKIEPRPRRN